MPDKEGAEEKTTKSVVNKKQKQMMGEEGYDVARDMGRVRPSKDKKDATSYPPSDEVKKTQKVNKGPSALERVKKKYKGQIMDVKKEELDLTKVAEAFGAYITEVVVKGKGPLKDIVKKLQKQGELDPQADTAVGNELSPNTKSGIESQARRENLGGYDDAKPTSVRKGTGGKSLEQIKKERLKYSDYSKEMRKLSAQERTSTKTKTPTPTKTKTSTRTKPKRLEGPELKKEIKKITKKPRTLVGSGKGFNTPAVLQTKKDLTTKAAKKTKVLTRTAQKKLIKPLARKAATKGIAKVGGKFVAKRIPGLGAVISGAEAVGKLATGDIVGAGLAAGEGILSSLPGVGTVASTALGGYSAVRDARRAAKATSTVRKVLKSTKGAKGAVAVKKAFKASPKITKKLSPTSKKGFKGFMSKVKDSKTAIGKAARIGGGVALDVATPGGITKKLLGIGAAARPKVDGGHVGRRTAG